MVSSTSNGDYDLAFYHDSKDKGNNPDAWLWGNTTYKARDGSDLALEMGVSEYCNLTGTKNEQTYCETRCRKMDSKKAYLSMRDGGVNGKLTLANASVAGDEDWVRSTVFLRKYKKDTCYTYHAAKYDGSKSDQDDRWGDVLSKCVPAPTEATARHPPPGGAQLRVSLTRPRPARLARGQVQLQPQGVQLLRSWPTTGAEPATAAGRRVPACRTQSLRGVGRKESD